MSKVVVNKQKIGLSELAIYLIKIQSPSLFLSFILRQKFQSSRWSCSQDSLTTHKAINLNISNNDFFSIFTVIICAVLNIKL